MIYLAYVAMSNSLGLYLLPSVWLHSTGESNKNKYYAMDSNINIFTEDWLPKNYELY